MRCLSCRQHELSAFQSSRAGIPFSVIDVGVTAAAAPIGPRSADTSVKCRIEHRQVGF